MRTIIALAAVLFFGAPVGAALDRPAIQDEDLGNLSDDELIKRYKTAVLKGKKEDKKAIEEELEKRGLHVFEAPGQSGGDEDADKRAKESMRTEHFDLKGPTKAILAAKADELEALAAKFRRLFDKAPKRGAIVFYEDKEARPVEREKGKLRVQVFAKSGNVTQRGDRWELRWGLVGDAFKDAGEAHPDLALTHEVMHLMLTDYVREEFPDATRKEAPAGRPSHYGTPLPDWVDEGLACLAEPEALRKIRRKHLTDPEAGAPRVDLAELLEMDHPTMGGSGDVMAFYSASYALVDFLVAKGGPKFFREVVARSAKGTAMKEVLSDEKIRPPELPADVTGLEKALLEYIGSEEFLKRASGK